MDSLNAGFTTGTPWLKINPNYKEINVLKDLSSVDGIYYLQKLLKIRKAYDCFIDGDFNLLDENNQAVFAYSRKK